MNDPNATAGGNGSMGQGFSDVPFDIPHIRVENSPAKASVRIGWFRSVANNYHVFAVQSFVDELAAAASRDRVEFLLEILGSDRLLDLKADAALQARVEDLAGRHSQGLLTPDEKANYGSYVSYSTFVAILKSKARQLLAASSGE